MLIINSHPYYRILFVVSSNLGQSTCVSKESRQSNKGVMEIVSGKRERAEVDEQCATDE